MRFFMKSSLAIIILTLNEAIHIRRSMRFFIFDVVVGLEVVERVYSPRNFAATIYLQNLALAVTGHPETHFTALLDDSHIKFWWISVS